MGPTVESPGARFADVSFMKKGSMIFAVGFQVLSKCLSNFVLADFEGCRCN